MLVATLQVKNLPDALHAQLAERARQAGTTMSDYVTRLLERDLGRPTVDEWLAAHPLPASGPQIDVRAVLDDVRAEYAPDVVAPAP
ncbi:FitA-like ribbon-helix-helix domain-containing protein [Cellulomonas phragmiteti]|uniref:Antitoxin FitA-like ribbon-helix-helix domain-containing protein n=1 Tax=Cellulomonas phragmiteti TaxID=478780 RepID=A0ABQ4DLL2_9CELL|nr:hypothetical protein [Cellulomonas phragmiteti]GIG40235.1 hypothetical protein Cph01nite_19970 [Cellulomonas phragmiteti]